MTTTHIQLDSEVLNSFLNECIFTGPNAEKVRSAMVDALRRSESSLPLVAGDEAYAAMGRALTELAWATVMIRDSGDKAGEIHHKPTFVGTKPSVSDRSMAFIREALRPANRPANVGIRR